ncbi:uncharacterized protein LOC128728619 [Anopheles nili]|uniref:uncharacterized protein LOC128728619 n=1 Tax=Anopheles nili TaxID=185578 RepID=UPI00237B6466|nr:uncharacterized protein LOC128728619 [Anopheles nili]
MTTRTFDVLFLLLVGGVLITSKNTPELAPASDVRQIAVGDDSSSDFWKCTETAKLLYIETMIVAKDDSSLVNGTIVINAADPMRLKCVRIVPQTKLDRLALDGYQFLGPNAVEITLRESQHSQSKALHYSVFLYGTILPKKYNKTS